jgi:hypothetical protein
MKPTRTAAELEALLLEQLAAIPRCRGLRSVEIKGRQVFEAGCNWWIDKVSIDSAGLLEADIAFIEARVIAAAAALGRQFDLRSR